MGLEAGRLERTDEVIDRRAEFVFGQIKKVITLFFKLGVSSSVINQATEVVDRGHDFFKREVSALRSEIKELKKYRAYFLYDHYPKNLLADLDLLDVWLTEIRNYKGPECAEILLTELEKRASSSA